MISKWWSYTLDLAYGQINSFLPEEKPTAKEIRVTFGRRKTVIFNMLAEWPWDDST
jgi:hypothetical protein